MEPTGVVVAADDRQIAYMDGGDTVVVPVVGLHGTPGCRLSRMIDDSVYAGAGVRYITTDRAGYGRSSRNAGRRVADEAEAVLAVANALGLARFSVAGSGGGPHALACAALLPDRVVRVACQFSLAPLGNGGLDRGAWLTGMDPEIAAELAWADSGEQRLFKEMTLAQALMSRRLRDEPGSIMGEEASEGDVAFLRRPEVVEAFRRIVAEQARNGVAGSVDDTLAFVSDWGFDLGSIKVPVLITWGDADSSCPPSHGQFLAQHVPTAFAFEVPGGGHFADDPRAEVISVYRWLAAGGVPDYKGNRVSGDRR